MTFGLIFMLEFAGTAMADGTWTKDSTGWRYQCEDGTEPQKQWQEIDGNWFYFNKNGYMVTGSRKIGSDYYYFKDSGAMAVGWIHDEDEDRWYYYHENGVRGKGWLFYDGAWYWLTSKGMMLCDGTKAVSGNKYYFFDNGQMAQNQYVGLNYYGDDGLRNSKFDIVVEGKRKATKEEKDRITEALKYVPREWIQHFVEHGWKIMYYTDKSFFAAPDTEAGVYYVYHKLDTDYKKLKFINPDSLTKAFGEYIGYASGCYKDSSEFPADFYMLKHTVNLLDELPGYFDDDIMAQFGSVFETFINPEMTPYFKEEAGELYDLIDEVIYKREGLLQ